jgi:hypothetical integral membrane protein (TIGR02206 family)
LTTPFVLFGASHLYALGASFVIPLVAVAAFRPSAHPTFDRALRWSLAALLTANWIAWMSLLYFKGWLGLGNELPLNLCDLATVATVATLVHPNQRTYELSYFWALAATLQGMLTPDLNNEFPDIEFVLFFVFHGGIIAAVLYMTLGLGWRPVPQSLPRVIVWTLSYAAVAGLADWILGTNYAFLRAKPPFATILGFMPDWPWYIPVLVAMGLMSAAIYYAPFFIHDWWVARGPREGAKA